MILAVTFSVLGVLQILFAVGVVVLLIVGLKWLAEKVGWTVPQPIWAIIGFLVIIAVIIWLLGGSPGITLR